MQALQIFIITNYLSNISPIEEVKMHIQEEQRFTVLMTIDKLGYQF